MAGKHYAKEDDNRSDTAANREQKALIATGQYKRESEQ